MPRSHLINPIASNYGQSRAGRRDEGIAVGRRFARRIGIPLTRGGRERKLGRMMTGGGCLVVRGLMVAIPVAMIAFVLALR